MTFQYFGSKKVFRRLMIAFLTALLLIGCANEDVDENQASEEETEVLTVGIGNVIPPQFFTDESGELVGYDVDVLKAIDDLLPQYTFEFEQLDLAATLVALEAGRIDIADWQFGRTAEREETFLYPDEPYDVGLPILITHEEQDELNRLADMGGLTMAQMPTSSFYTYLTGYNDENPENPINIQTVESLPVADAMDMVSSGRIDGTIALAGTYNKLADEMNAPTRSGDIIDAYGVYYILEKDNIELKEVLDEAIRELRESGVIAELSEKWYGLDNFAEYTEFTGDQSFE